MSHMNKLKLILFGLILVLNSTLLYAASWQLIPDPTNLDALRKPIILNEKAYIFQLDEMQCGVTKVTVNKLEDNYFEMRHLYCYVTKDARVSNVLSFNIKDTSCVDTITLSIDKKDKSYGPMLYVSCKNMH